jgi:hypothetical protein
MFIIEMTGSTITAKLSRGFVGEYEVDLLLMAISISLLLTGPGRISVEWNVLKRDYFQKVSKQYYSNYRRHKSEFLRTQAFYSYTIMLIGLNIHWTHEVISGKYRAISYVFIKSVIFLTVYLANGRAK